MAARATVGAFSFPSPRGCTSPSMVEAELGRLSRIASVLCGALFISLLGTALLAHLAAKRADVIPYVADGGLFGCEVRILSLVGNGS